MGRRAELIWGGGEAGGARGGGFGGWGGEVGGGVVWGWGGAGGNMRGGFGRMRENDVGRENGLADRSFVLDVPQLSLGSTGDGAHHHTTTA